MAKIKKKRTKKYTPRDEMNPIAVAMNCVAKLSFEEQCRLMQPVNASFARLRSGEAREEEWEVLNEMLDLAKALTMPGIARLLPDHKDKFDAGAQVLESLADRVLERDTWTCYADELAAVEDALEHYCIQIQFASRNEMNKALLHVRHKNRGWHARQALALVAA